MAYATVALAFAGRKCEVVDCKVGDFSRVTDENNKATYHIYYDRSKNSEAMDTDREMCVVNCTLGIAALDRYIALRPAGLLTAEHKSKRFFRRIADGKGGALTMGWKAQSIGKGPCSEVSKKSKNVYVCTYLFIFTTN
jgi:hypothetical protein